MWIETEATGDSLVCRLFGQPVNRDLKKLALANFCLFLTEDKFEILQGGTKQEEATTVSC